MTKDSEFRAYSYIEQALKDLGWDTRNPARGGQVYTQGEFRKHDTLLTEALGKKAPENTVLIPWDRGHLYWIIEAKPLHSEITKATNEAKKYAEKVNELDKNGGGRQDSLRDLPELPTVLSWLEPATGIVKTGKRL